MPRTLTWTPEQDRRHQKKKPSKKRERPDARSSRPAPKSTGSTSVHPTGQATSIQKHRPEKKHNIAEMYILKQIREKSPMVLHGYGVTDHCLFVKLSKYHLTTLVDGKKKGNEKLGLSCYYKQRDEDQVHQVMRLDDEIVSLELVPIRPRKDRYVVVNEILAQSRRESSSIEITLRTGHVLQGYVLWFTPYDIGLMLPTKVKVMIFRHAIYRVKADVVESQTGS